MRRRFRRKRHAGEDVQLNLAAMLDMAFQLLAFFILTFRPAPVEGQLALNLPPPVPVTKVQTPTEPTEGSSDSTGLETLPLSVTADAAGRATQVRVGSVTVVDGLLDAAGLARLDAHLKTIIGEEALFDRMQIAADGRLHYGDLMKILDVCRRQKGPGGKAMEDISIVEAGGGG
jgi:biopolymer transport protein ExbD